jgi:hypothetical protein
MAQPLLAGPAGAAMTTELANLIEARLAPTHAAHSVAPIVAARFIACQIAGSQMALLRGWLGDPSSCTSTALASAIHRSSRALAASLMG